MNKIGEIPSELRRTLLREPRSVIIFGVVFSAEEKGSFNIGKLDDSVMQIALLRHKI